MIQANQFVICHLPEGKKSMLSPEQLEEGKRRLVSQALGWLNFDETARAQWLGTKTDLLEIVRYVYESQPIHIERLRALCQQSLEPLRRRFGAIRVTSGYRSQRLNALVGGAPTSQHTMGEAADIHTGGRETSQKMYDYARQHVPYDQLILERKVSHGTYWLHLSLRSDRPGNRHEAFQLTVK